MRAGVRYRLALLLLVVTCLTPALVRLAALRPRSARACQPEGRGVPPRHHIGCAGDPGEPRALRGEELLLLGRPLDLNAASPGELALVPGLSPALGEAIAADRALRGRFAAVDELVRVRGIGPGRLASARAHLAVSTE